ncbi:efflux RND transporter periplasmic adaptor subunit [Nissabacter sp. SGAir0207]|uniref:efflux RND transporter periplasmic adaptor subunit n=1 Tax=Nissabacter sp. SGAir0207 TaxID=2126321 RepID=UPI0010CCBA21|nr:efflux RND transporter periplasmic adaptor subunit [Nissabacter sp. SGAir0207]QCR35390.1 efflux transporter periplasmic adaptor subunit [Nissabacter sp. SGAir0207]
MIASPPKERSRSSRRRRWLVLPALLIIALAGYAVLHRPAPPTYLTATAARQDLEHTVLADGAIEAQKLVSVGAQVSGQIKALHVALGDKVIPGQLVAEIDDLTQQNSLRDAQAALKNVQAQQRAKQAQLENDRLTFTRQRDILARGVGVQADYDSAKAELERTDAELKALEAQIVQAQIAENTAQVNLGYTKIRAPMAGTVVAIPVEAGQTVNAVQSTPTIIKVADLDTMTIKAQISEADVVNVRTGMPVYFTILGQPEQRYRATLRAIEPAPDSINDDTSNSFGGGSAASASTSTAVYYNGLFDVANPQGVLRISMTAQVYIVLSSIKDALVVPATALRRDGNRTLVQVVDAQGEAHDRPVTVGLNNNVEAQITGGLQAGEKVVLNLLNGSAPGRP